MRVLRAFTLFFLIPCLSFAQSGESSWDLQRCIKYAVDHNISIKQDSLTARLSKYTLYQSRMSQLPIINASGSYGKSFGRSIDPTSNQFVEGSYNFMSTSGSVNLVVFGWMQVRNTIEKNKYNLQASLADLDQLRDDISINVANSYLAALLAKEQIGISEYQISVSKAQLDQTRAFADAGRVPELNVAQLESQLATDSSNLINSIASYTSAVLDLKTLLNLDFTVPFEVVTPQVEPVDLVAGQILSPEEIFAKANSHFGAIKSSELRVKAAEKSLAAAKGGLYPQLSVGYQLGTNFASNSQSPTRFIDTVLQPGSYILDNLNNPQYVYEPYKVPVYANTSFHDQFNNNFRQSLSLNLNIPILNGWQSQYGVKTAKISLASQQLNAYSAELTLRQNVYKAHNNAASAIQKYNAAKHADDAAAKALDYAKKRYDLGLSTTVDLLVTQNSKFNAATNLIISKYDLLFKLKVIDYYSGKELKL